MFHFGWFDPGRMAAFVGLASGIAAPAVCGLLSPEEDVGSGRMLIVMLGGLVVNVLLFVVGHRVRPSDREPVMWMAGGGP